MINGMDQGAVTSWSIAGAVILIIAIISGIGIFKKIGVPGWKAVVPIMNMANFFDKMKTSDDYWGMILTGGFLVFLGGIIPYGSLKNALNIIGCLICAAFWLIICLNGARKFGKSTGFAIGMFLIPFVFFPILAFGNAVYNKDA